MTEFDNTSDRVSSNEIIFKSMEEEGVIVE